MVVYTGNARVTRPLGREFEIGRVRVIPEILKPKLQDFRLDGQILWLRSNLRFCNFGFKFPGLVQFQIPPNLPLMKPPLTGQGSGLSAEAGFPFSARMTPLLSVKKCRASGVCGVAETV